MPEDQSPHVAIISVLLQHPKEIKKASGNEGLRLLDITDLDFRKKEWKNVLFHIVLIMLSSLMDIWFICLQKESSSLLCESKTDMPCELGNEEKQSISNSSNAVSRPFPFSALKRHSNLMEPKKGKSAYVGILRYVIMRSHFSSSRK